MANLPWTDDPRIASQSILDRHFQYLVFYPAHGQLINFEAVAYKPSPASGGLGAFAYSLGAFNNLNLAQRACQDDYDQHGPDIPEGSQPWPPMSIEQKAYAAGQRSS
jgi:hypothetical protein